MNQNGDIYNKMKEKEIVELVEFSPNNLKDFFDNSIEDQIDNLPGFGVLKSEPTSFFISDNAETKPYRCRKFNLEKNRKKY
jgi:hypothetical protein